MIYVNVSSFSLDLYGCPFFASQDSNSSETPFFINAKQGDGNDVPTDFYETGSKILPQRVFEVIMKVVYGEKVWLGVPLAFLGPAEVKSYPSTMTCLWTPWDPNRIAKIVQPTHTLDTEGNIAEKEEGRIVYYSANSEMSVHSAASRASSVLSTLKKYQCFEARYHVFGDTEQVWAKLEALEGWICVSSVSEGTLDVQEIPLKHPQDQYSGQFSKYFRNVFQGRVANFLPVRTRPSLKSTAAGKLKGWAVFPAEHCVVSPDHLLWVKVCSMDLDDGAAWAIVRSATTGKMALEPCLGPGSEVFYYRNCYSKGALQLRQSPSSDAEVSHTLPLGTCFRSSCRVFSNQQLWISCEIPGKEEAWVTEINEENGNIMLQRIQSPEPGHLVYRSIHSGCLTVMSEPRYGQDSKALGKITQGSFFIGVERQLDERFEMWVKVYKDTQEESQAGWVPESVGGTTNSIEIVDGIDLKCDLTLIFEAWKQHISRDQENIVEVSPAPLKDTHPPPDWAALSFNPLLDLQDDLIDMMELNEVENIDVFQEHKRSRSHTKQQDTSDGCTSNHEWSRKNKMQSKKSHNHQMKKDEFDLLAQLNDFADNERARKHSLTGKDRNHVDPPRINPPSGQYELPLLVEMSCKPASGRIMYCFDEKYPRWIEYIHDQPICLTKMGRTRLRAKVTLPWGQESISETVEYAIQGKRAAVNPNWTAFCSMCPAFVLKSADNICILAKVVKQSLCNSCLSRRNTQQSYQSVALQESDGS